MCINLASKFKKRQDVIKLDSSYFQLSDYASIRVKLFVQLNNISSFEEIKSGVNEACERIRPGTR